jgi:hypothetical protein
MGNTKPFVQGEKRNGHDALSQLSNEDDEKLGDTKWAGTHLSSTMKSTTTQSPPKKQHRKKQKNCLRDAKNEQKYT